MLPTNPDDGKKECFKWWMQAALSWMVLNYLNIVGAAFMQALANIPKHSY